MKHLCWFMLAVLPWSLSSCKKKPGWSDAGARDAGAPLGPAIPEASVSARPAAPPRSPAPALPLVRGDAGVASFAHGSAARSPSAGGRTAPTSPTPPTASRGQRLCFALKDKTLDARIELRIDGARVTGDASGVIEDRVAGYFSSYRQRLAGTRSGEALSLTETTEIEGDKQEQKVTWILRGDRLTAGRRGDVYRRAPCR